MHTCRKCKTKIADDRKYCSVHYKEAMAQYHRDIKQHENDLSEWRSSSAMVRDNADDMAETAATGFYAAGAGAIAGVVGWIVLYKSKHIDALYGLLLVFTCIVLFASIPVIRVLMGRIARVIVKAAIYFVILAILSWLLSLMSKIVSANISVIIYGEMFAVVIFSLIRELTGGHHASAAPIRPTEPRH